MRIGEVAAEVGLHPNTIRIYEQWGFLRHVKRNALGHRVYETDHLRQIRLIRMAFRCTWIGGEIRRTAHAMIRAASEADYVGSYVLAKEHHAMIRRERRRAEQAANLLQSWANRLQPRQELGFLRIGETARLLGVSTDQLRHWERCGLIHVPRDPDNGYRLYGRDEVDRLRIIRGLMHARYSTMAVLRMMKRLDAGIISDARRVLDTPDPEEDVLSASDRWLHALRESESSAQEIVFYVGQWAIETEK